jgi:hypothetical protein
MPVTIVPSNRNTQRATRERRVVILFTCILSICTLRFLREYGLSLDHLLDTHRFYLSDRNSTSDAYTIHSSDSSEGFPIKNSNETYDQFLANGDSISDQYTTFDATSPNSSNSSEGLADDPSLSQGYSVSDGISSSDTPNTNSSDVSGAFPIKNVLLMGQFNFNPTSAQLVQDWVSVWSDYFSNVMVTGPFSLEIGNELDALGIAYHRGRDDAGWASVYETLGNVARELLLGNSSSTNNNNLHNGTISFTGIDAILYMHDDALLNISYILDRNDGVFPKDQFLWNGYENEAMEDQYTYFVEVVQETWENGTIRRYRGDNNNNTERFFTDRIVRMENQQRRRSVVPREFPWTRTTSTDSVFPFLVRYSNRLITSPFREDDSSRNQSETASTLARYVMTSPGNRWPYIDWCMKRHLIMLVEGPRQVLDPYAISVDERSIENQINGETVRSIQVSRQFKFLLNMQADFFLLPMEWADEFSRLAEVFATDDVFLESAVVTMGRWIMSKHENKKDSTSGEGTDQKLRAQNIPLCTTWYKNRGKVAMIDTCLKQSAEGMGLYHPFKIGSVGIDEFKRLQAIVQRPSPEARMALAATERRKP